MADMFDPNNANRPPEDAEFGETPYAQEPPEVEDDAPRRAASARFIVDSEVGSEAAMRDAMDPANQSLADALRLSFRVLQVVILVLVVLFLGSGFQTVEDSYSGVHTVWGKIVTVEGEQGLTPGLKFSFYPYPAGEFHLFRQENRTVGLERTFMPRARAGRTEQEAIDSADVGQELDPSRDGSLLSTEGDLTHMELSAQYEIDQPQNFVHQVNDADAGRNADRLVQLALQRAAIHVAATTPFSELTNPQSEATVAARIQEEAQEVLDGCKGGIRIVAIEGLKGRPPLAIERALGDLQAAQVWVDQATEEANKSRVDILTRVAGSDFENIVRLVEQYEDAIDAGKTDEADRLLASINEKLESADAQGEVSGIIGYARTYQSEIEQTLGTEYARFASLLPAYRKNPQLVVRQLWLDAYAEVMNHPDTEIIQVPDLLGMIQIDLTGSALIRETRRLMDIDRSERQAGAEARRGMGGSSILRATEVTNRQLVPDRDAEGRLKPALAPR